MEKTNSECIFTITEKMARREGRSPRNICRIVFLMKETAEKTKADSPKTEIFNCAISAYGDAN